jgi:hypothetical protein
MLSSVHLAIHDVPAPPDWFATALTVMDDATVKEVLMAVAAAASSAVRSLVSRSDKALTAPCAASAVRWYALTVAVTVHS